MITTVCDFVPWGGEKERVTENKANNGREEERKMVAVWTEDCVPHMIDRNRKQYFVKKFYSNNVFLWMKFL